MESVLEPPALQDLKLSRPEEVDQAAEASSDQGSDKASDQGTGHEQDLGSLKAPSPEQDLTSGPETARDFKRKVESIVGSGAMALSLSLGVQLGLFKALSELKVPASPTYIAKVADCNERFLREWLFHMVVGGVVETDESGARYSLPAHRSVVLQTDGAVELTTFLPSMGKLYDDLLRNFKTGNTSGAIFRLPETDFCRRWELRQKEVSQKLMDVLLQHVPSLKGELEQGINVLDVGCGRGHFVFSMATKYPTSLFTGIDINDSLISDARDRARSHMLRDMSFTNVSFVDYDAAILPTEWSGRFDVVMMHEVVYNLPSPADVVWELKQVLKPGGLLVVVDRSVLAVPRENTREHARRITALIAPIVSMNYNLPVALSQPEGDSEALGSCTGKEKLVELIEEAYYTDVETHEFTLDEQKVEFLVVARND